MSENLTTIFSSAARTSTTASSTFTFGDVINLNFYLNVTAVSGTTPSMTVTIQDSPDGTNWYTLVAFTAATATTSEVKRTTNNGKYIRANAVISGTNPSFTFTLHASGAK